MAKLMILVRAAGRRRPVMAAGALALVLSGCANRGGPVPYDVAGFTAPDPVAVTQPNAEYRIGPGDVLAVAVFRVPDLTRDVLVGADGTFAFPLLGQVPASGRTVAQISGELKQSLSGRYLQNPEVEVTVRTAQGQKVTVDGSVRNPGLYPIAGDTTLLQAVALASGLNEEANPRRTVVFRTIGGQRVAAAFDIADIRRGLQPDPRIYAGDIVVVDGVQGLGRYKELLTTVPLIGLFAR